MSQNKTKIITMKLGEGKTTMSKRQLDKLRAVKDEDIDTSDIPELDEKWFKNAIIIRSNTKKSTTLRIDTPVLSFYKQQGKGYQTFINEVLKEYAKQHGMKT